MHGHGDGIGLEGFGDGIAIEGGGGAITNDERPMV